MEQPLTERVAELRRLWESITEVPTRPRSVMNVIEYGLGEQRRAEVYVNRLLRYFLDPREPHGMDSDFLEAFLKRLPSDCEFREDLYELSTIEVGEQVPIKRFDPETGEVNTRGFLDLLIEVPGEWFLLVELKFSAEETGTTFYCDADTVGGRPKTDYESGEYYLYMHQADEPQASGACFANWTWGAFLEDVVEPFLLRQGPRYPQRTVNQLRELSYDITEITGMSEHEQSEQEKIDLYIENYDAISDLTSTFEDRWDTFSDEWHQRLITRINDPELTDDWVFWEYGDDWAFIYKMGWWRRIDTFEPISEPIDSDRVRVGFLHRLEENRDLALGEHTLKFYFRNTPPNRHLETDNTNFRDSFVENFTARRDEIQAVLPERASLTGNMHNMIEATYDIPVAESEDFFTAYITALHTAFTEHVSDNPELVRLIDTTYHATVEDFQ